jgi:hypothetical protein
MEYDDIVNLLRRVELTCVSERSKCVSSEALSTHRSH